MIESSLVAVFITAVNAAEARRLADALLTARLAACVNIVADVSSYYRWQGKIEDANETLLMVKSRTVLLDNLIECVKGLHSYEVPEIIALPILGGNVDYLRWIENETTPQT